MKYQRERLSDHINECDQLVKDYFDRTIAWQGMPPLAMNWGLYKKAEEVGNLLFFTARDDDKVMQGFSMYIVSFDPHYHNHKFAQCDILAVRPEWRGRGIGKWLVTHAELALKRHGVDRMIHRFRTIYDVEPLFTKLGFTEVERTYMKVL